MTTPSRSGVKHERRRLIAELFDRVQRSTVHLRALAGARLDDELHLERNGAAVAAHRDAGRRLAEADQLRIVARTR